jgi:hypothetical protein
MTLWSGPGGKPTLDDIEEEFPEWNFCRSPNGLYYGWLPGKPRGRDVHGEEPMELRDAVIRIDALECHSGRTPTACDSEPPLCGVCGGPLAEQPGAQPLSTPAQVRQAITTLTTGNGLHVTSDVPPGYDRALAITNPAKPARGMVLVDLDTGHVCWIRDLDDDSGVADNFGRLEGITSTDWDELTDEAKARPVPALMILHLLTAHIA